MERHTPGMVLPLTTHVHTCRGYINFYAVYIGWLVAAVFLHLPSFKSLGFDVRTDVSMLLTVFLLSALVRPSCSTACPRCLFPSCSTVLCCRV